MLQFAVYRTLTEKKLISNQDRMKAYPEKIEDYVKNDYTSKVLQKESKKKKVFTPLSCCAPKKGNYKNIKREAAAIC